MWVRVMSHTYTWVSWEHHSSMLINQSERQAVDGGPSHGGWAEVETLRWQNMNNPLQFPHVSWGATPWDWCRGQERGFLDRGLPSSLVMCLNRPQRGSEKWGFLLLQLLSKKKSKRSKKNNWAHPPVCPGTTSPEHSCKQHYFYLCHNKLIHNLVTSTNKSYSMKINKQNIPPVQGVKCGTITL